MMTTDENGMATVWLPPVSIGTRRDVNPVRITIGPASDTDVGMTTVRVYEDGQRDFKYGFWRMDSYESLLVTFATTTMHNATNRLSTRRARWLKFADQIEQKG